MCSCNCLLSCFVSCFGSDQTTPNGTPPPMSGSIPLASFPNHLSRSLSNRVVLVAVSPPGPVPSRSSLASQPSAVSNSQVPGRSMIYSEENPAVSGTPKTPDFFRTQFKIPSGLALLAPLEESISTDRLKNPQALSPEPLEEPTPTGRQSAVPLLGEGEHCNSPLPGAVPMYLDNDL